MTFRKTLHLSAFAVPAVILWNGAIAQVAPGHFGPKGGALVPQNIVSKQVGECVVRRDRPKAAAYVLAHGGDRTFSKVLRDLMPVMQGCLGITRSATLDAAYLRGGIAEGLLQENGAALLTKASAIPAVQPVRMTSADSGEPVVAIMGCAAAAQPSDAAVMLRNPPESPAEAVAFRALIPSMQACAPTTGEVRFSPARVRPAVAIALYREVAAR